MSTVTEFTLTSETGCQVRLHQMRERWDVTPLTTAIPLCPAKAFSPMYLYVEGDLKAAKREGRRVLDMLDEVQAAASAYSELLSGVREYARRTSVI